MANINTCNFQMSFKNEHLIFEKTVKCTIKDHEYNYSYNPSLLQTDSKENLKTFATGSIFNPYVTMVGLYNDENQLLAIGKMSQPLPMTYNTDLNIILKLDM